MAIFTPVYGLLNDAAKESLGVQAITVKDSTSFASLGNVVLSTSQNTDAFYNKLSDRIGRTVIASRAKKKKLRKVLKNDMQYGIALQKISFAMKEASANPAWVTNTQASPYDIEPQSTIIQKIFSCASTYDFADSYPVYQLFTAFTNEVTMAAFMAGLYTRQEKDLAIAEENLANLAVNTNIAVCLSSTNKNQARNILAEYETASGKTLAAANALTDVDFLKYATREIIETTKKMTSNTVLFNDKTIDRETPVENQVVEILGQFASAQAAYLQADTYHKELVELPSYEEVVYWQAPGTDFSFDNCSKINIVNQNVNNGTAVEQGGIIAFIHDEESCGSIINNHRSGSLYNGYAERLNVWDHADKGFYVDSSENAVVFYIAD